MIYSSSDYDQHSLEKQLQDHEVEYTTQALNLSSVQLAAGCDAISVFSGDVADEQVIKGLSELGILFITTRSVGYEHINLEAAERYGIKVANIPSYSPYSVSEHAIGLLLSLVRNLRKSHQQFQKKDFRLDGLLGFDLHGKKVGVIGCGRIG